MSSSSGETAGDGMNGGGDAPNAQQGAQPGLRRVMDHMGADKVKAALWISRILTVFFSISFLLPIFGGDPMSHYQKALLGTAVTSALRLHQRVPQFSASREWVSGLFMEDSCHYLLYSLIFINSYPVTLSLVPAFLFALLHSGNYTKELLDQFGEGSVQPLRNLLTKLEQNNVQILRFIACTEIFMMPSIIFMMFFGHSSLLLPFIYYRFLTLRYTSRRNPYNRQLFYELRIAAYQLSQHPSCPGLVRNITDKVVALICRLAPPLPQDAQAQQPR